MEMHGSRAAGLAATVVAALLVLGFDAAAQDAGKTPLKTASACKGLDEKACRGKATECLWITPKKGKQKPYCRLRSGTKKKT